MLRDHVGPRRGRWSTWAAVSIIVVSGVACSWKSIDPIAEAEATFAQQAAAVRGVTDDDLSYLDGLESKLRRVNLSRTQITDQGLARLCTMSELEQLRLSSSRITDEGITSIGRLEHLRFLHLLDLPMTDAGLDALHSLKNLESLYLDRTKVTDDGLARLVAAMPQVHLHIDDHHHALDSHAAEHTH